VVTEIEPGIVMELDSRDFVTRTLMLEGKWEEATTRAILGPLSEGSVFIDMGAHVGYYSLLASRRVGQSGRVVTIEANPVTATRLRRNLELSRVSNVTVYELACADEEREFTFFAANAINPGQSSLSGDNAGHARTGVTVSGSSLDRIVAPLRLGRVDVVKMDVEGAELKALVGMRQVLQTYRPKLVMELKDELLRGMGASIGQVEEFLTQQGYARELQIDDFGNCVWASAQQR
jgi:FkbM family methyltransferase